MNLISFGKKQTYIFEEVDIDEKVGFPIYANGLLVGGFLANHNKVISKDITFCGIMGIEIKKNFRKRGIASSIIKNILERYDAVTGAITEEDAVGFWMKIGANVFEIPDGTIPKECNNSIHINKPLCFYISNEKNSDYFKNIFSKLKPYK
jgi:predicted acetyltransferase